MSVLALFNSFGRILAGFLSDKIGVSDADALPVSCLSEGMCFSISVGKEI